MDYRAKPGTLLMVGEVQHGQPWYHEADLPVKDMMSPKYFSTWKHELKPGDTIRLVRIRNQRVSEMAEIMVIQVHLDHIEHTQLGPVRKFPIPEEQKAEEIHPEKYAKGDGYTIKRAFQGRYDVLDAEGNVVAKGLLKKEAEAIQWGNMPIPEMAA